MQKEPFVSIVICTHNRVDSLKRLALKSILELNYSNYEIVIVDDASKDNTKDLIKKYQNKIKNLKYIKNNKSRGLCYVRNLGVNNSKGEIIAFTDDDCYVDKNWLKELVKPYLKDKKVMVVGGKSYIKNTKRLYNPINEIYGCNMSFKKNVFDKFLFDVNLIYSHIRDETDLILRIKNKNLKIIFTDKATIKHFLKPADYRSKVILGGFLNIIYSCIKKTNLEKYYYLFLHSIFYSMRNNIPNKLKKDPIEYRLCKIHRISFSFLAFMPIIKRLLKNNSDYKKILEKNISYKKYYKIWPKIPYIYYLTLIEIPIKAKIKNLIEERIFKKGTNKCPVLTKL